MEAKGQVERLPHDSDRRVTLVRITRKGAKAVEHLMELAREHELRVLEPFGLQRAEELKSTLRQMIELHATCAGRGGTGHRRVSPSARGHQHGAAAMPALR